MPTVYLPAIPMRYDPLSGVRVPVLDTSSAQDYGLLLPLLTIERALSPDEMGAAITELRTNIASIEATDYIVCIGDPIFIAVAAEVALRKNGTVRMLRWDRLAKAYQLVEVKS